MRRVKTGRQGNEIQLQIQLNIPPPSPFSSQSDPDIFPAGGLRVTLHTLPLLSHAGTLPERSLSRNLLEVRRLRYDHVHVDMKLFNWRGTVRY